LARDNASEIFPSIIVLLIISSLDGAGEKIMIYAIMPSKDAICILQPNSIMNNDHIILNWKELESKSLPRVTLRVESFRKYEPYIGKACYGSYAVKCKTPELPMKASTFLVGFCDARKGKEVYGYESKLIPLNYNLYHIKAKELDGQVVLLKNEYQDSVNARMYGGEQPLPGQVGGPDIKREEMSDIGPVNVSWWPQEEEKILALLKQFWEKGLRGTDHIRCHMSGEFRDMATFVDEHWPWSIKRQDANAITLVSKELFEQSGPKMG
jgi:hypothetical protein